MHALVRWRRRCGVMIALLGAGCSVAVSSRSKGVDASFFPLTPLSRWEYVVHQRGRSATFRFVATVNPDDFRSEDGRTCRVVDERYTDVGEEERFPIVYCNEGGYLHRVMSLEYRAGVLSDNGLRSGELKFLPTDLEPAQTWEGHTNAYRLSDGSGFDVRQLHHVSPSREQVVVQAGAFAHCMRVETTAIHSAIDVDGRPVGPRLVYYYSDWYAPGVGLVKTEQRDESASVLATIELVSYVIGRDPVAR
jgi:hypothetical protein